MRCKNKSQVSFEFVMIFALALVMIAGFSYVINQRLSEINKEQEILVMKNLANNIKNEVLLAASVNNNYLRRFDIPANLNGKKYKMTIDNVENSLTIQTLQGNSVDSEYFTILPTNVTGNFIDDISYNNTEHCITKNDIDGVRTIRIARNQVSLDANVGSAKIDDTFYITVSLNCVKSIRSTQFTIKYDPTVLQIQKDMSAPITNKELNPLFEEVNPLDYNGINLNTETGSYPYIDDSIGRYTFGFIGKNCATGSGNIAQLYFKVIGAPASGGKTEVDFEPSFGDNNLIVLDCTTNKFTKNDVPNSKKRAEIEITN